MSRYIADNITTENFVLRENLTNLEEEIENKNKIISEFINKEKILKTAKNSF